MANAHTIGLFGGTFDPIHFGHLRAALEIQEQLELDEVRFIPCKHPPHREPTKATANDRLRMVRLAIEGTSLRLDDQEVQREGPSYSVDTLMAIRLQYPKASLCLIMGNDVFLGLTTWHAWEKIMQLSNIIITSRITWKVPDTGPLADLLQQHSLSYNEHLKDFVCGRIVQKNISLLDISASKIRALIQNGHSPQFLLPDSVYQYIQQHSLYGYPGNFTKP